MKTYNEIEEAIESNDIHRLRRAVASLAYVDLDFSEGIMDEQIKYIEEKGINLKEDHLSDDPIISKSKDVFDDDDFSEAVRYLKENFCDERIEDLKIISKAVNAKKPESKPVRESNPNPAPSKAPSGHSNEGGTSNKKTDFAPFVAIAAIIAAIIAFFKGNRK